MRDEVDEVAVPCAGKLLGKYGMLDMARKAVNDARRKLMPTGHSKAQWKTGTTCRYLGTRKGRSGKVELVYEVRRVSVREVV